MSFSDYDLYQRACRGGKRAAIELFDRHGAAVLAAVEAQADDKALVADAVQDAWLIIFRGAPFREGSFRRWAIRIALREYARAYRRAVKNLLWDAEQDHALALRPPSVTRASREVLRAELRQSIEDLENPDQRLAARLRWLQGMTAVEIADYTGAPVKTVESRLRLAKAELCRRLLGSESAG